jgi:hypothetical protein
MTRTAHAIRPLAATLLVAVLALGGAAHLAHHLADPHCDDGPGPRSHPCVSCSALHGAALVAESVAAAPPAAAGASLHRSAPDAAPVVSRRGGAPPRAPPLG